MFFLNLLYILIALFLFGTILLIAFLYVPLALLVNTDKKEYRISFPGGFVRYEEREGDKGLFYKFFFWKGFTPFSELKEEKKEEEKKEEDEEEKPKIPLKKRPFVRVLYEEKPLARRILKKFFRFLKRIYKLLTVRKIDCAFSVKDPYACGLYYAFTGPFMRHNVSIRPSFLGENYILADLFIVPARVIWQFILFIFSLPLKRLYGMYRRMKVLEEELKEEFPDKGDEIEKAIEDLETLGREDEPGKED